MPWHLQDGQVRHDYAKWKLKKFLDACYRKQRRLNRDLHYLWVAERQQNGNIHFHILWNQFFPIQYLTRIWAQASNSVDIVRVKDALHAARYMQKYMTKEESSEIQGNRYFISKKLRNDMMPVVDVLVNVPSMSLNPPDSQCLKDVRQFLSDTREYIESSGGFLLDLGFNIPPPATPSKWTCKRTGQAITSRGVSPVIAKQLYSALYDITEPLPF